MVWIQIWTDILSVLIWAQTLWKGYQQTTKVEIIPNKLMMPCKERVINAYKNHTCFFMH